MSLAETGRSTWWATTERRYFLTLVDLLNFSIERVLRTQLPTQGKLLSAALWADGSHLRLGTAGSGGPTTECNSWHLGCTRPIPRALHTIN